MIIKTCGMRDADNIREVEALGIDWMGFIFWPKSSRFVSQHPDYLPNQVKRVGVFVDEEAGRVIQTADEYGLDLIQLHGHESPEYLSMLKGHRIIKAFNIAIPSDFRDTAPYEGLADYFLFDTRRLPEETGGKLLPGGTGKKFDWGILETYKGNTPFLLSGGIGSDDVEQVRAINHPKCIGIDLNSRFEISPGLKDVNKLKQFIENIKK